MLSLAARCADLSEAGDGGKHLCTGSVQNRGCTLTKPDVLLAGTRRRPAAEDSVPPSLQILHHTHILTARTPAPYSPTTPRRAQSPTAFSGPIARPPPSPAHAPCSPQTGPPDSATSPVIVLYSRALCARLCVLALPPSPAGFPMSAHLSRPRLFQRHLRSLGWVWVWVWDWVHTPRHTLLSFSPPSFHTISLSLAFTSA